MVGATDNYVRFVLPDAVLRAAGDGGSSAGLWMDGRNANESMMLRSPEVGSFVRALLPVRLTEGYTVTYALWVLVEAAGLQEAFRAWGEPEYADLVLEGSLANEVPPWGLLGAPVELRVIDPAQAPYCVASTDEELETVLTIEWERDKVLSTLPQWG